MRTSGSAEVRIFRKVTPFLKREVRTYFEMTGSRQNINSKRSHVHTNLIIGVRLLRQCLRNIIVCVNKRQIVHFLKLVKTVSNSTI